MAVFNSNILAGASGQTSEAAAFQIDRSLRFNSADSAYLNRTPSSSSIETVWTFSFWIKLNKVDGNRMILTSYVDSSNDSMIRINGNGYLEIYNYRSGAYKANYISNAQFRDPSSWYHFVISANGSTSLNAWVNGVAITFSTSTGPDGTDWLFNGTNSHQIGRYNTSANSDFQLAEVQWVDGQALAASDFGEYDDNNVWQPKEFGGTYGPLVNQAETWSSVIKAGGTSYSPSDSNTGFLSAYPATQAFDFATTGSVAYSDNNNVWIYFTPATALTVSSTIRFGARNTVEVKINGTDYSYTGGDTTGDQTIRSISFSGSLTEFAIRDDDNSGYSTGLSFLEIDGVLLVDNGVTVPDNSFYLKFADNSSNSALGTDSSGNDNDWTVNNLTAAAFGWESTTWSDDISIDSGNYYLNNNDGPNGFDGSSSTYIDCRLGTGSNDTTNIIWTPTGGIAGVTKIRVHSEYASHYRINEGTWTSFTSSGSYTQIYSGTAFTLTKLEVRRDDNGGTDYGHRVTAYELNDIEVQDDLAQNDAYNIDSLIDTPTNYTADSGNNGGNYCSFNPLNKTGGITLSNGNLDAACTANSADQVLGTIAIPRSGKYYFEFTIGSNYYGYVGISNNDKSKLVGRNEDGRKYTEAGHVSTPFTSFTAGDVIGVALNNNTTLTFYKNGVAESTTVTVDSDQDYFPFANFYNATFILNAGQRPFSQTVPTDHLSLCTTNLPDPTIADGSTAFDATLFTGNGSSQTISGINHSPDFVWIKNRSDANDHVLTDTVRGVQNYLITNKTDAEATSAQALTAFTSDGFSVGNNDNFNNNTDSLIAWTWEAADSNTSLSAGSSNSSVYNTSDKWSDDVSGDTYGGADMPKSRMFNGNLTQNVIANSGTSLTFSPSGLSSISSLRIYGNTYTNNANGITVNGTDYTSSFPQGGGSSAAWVTIPETSLTSVVWSTTGSGLENGSLYAIEVDGKLLVDNDQTPPNVPSIASTVRANQSAGFSIVTYTGNGTNNSTIGHGLNAAPDFVIIKNRDSAYDWAILHTSAGTTGTTLDGSAEYNMLYFSTAAASDFTNDNIWDPTSTTVKINGAGTGNWVNKSGDDYVMYSWAPVEGYSAFGSYEGTGNSDGPFVYTGFKPRWVMYKNADATEGWGMTDTARSVDNPADEKLEPNTSSAEATVTNRIDVLSNGFKIRAGSAQSPNESGNTYIYAAFAEHPLKTARAR